MPELEDIIHEKLQQEWREESASKLSTQSKDDHQVGDSELRTPIRKSVPLRNSGITPSGTPRAISYELPRTCSGTRLSGDILNQQQTLHEEYEDATDDPQRIHFNRANSDFKGGFDIDDPNQREKEREALAKRNRERERQGLFLNRRFFSFTDGEHVSPSPSSPLASPRYSLHEPSTSKLEDKGKGTYSAPVSPQSKRGNTMPNLSDIIHKVKGQQSPISAVETAEEGMLQEGQRREGILSGTASNTAQRWAKLKSLLPRSITTVPKDSLPTITPMHVNITDELLVGGLSTLLLRMWFERDEKERRRVPVMLHRLKVRVIDSLHPLKGSKAVFRIECQYANSAFRWVVYRQLRDFLSLHAHYRVSNAYNRNIETMPDFPRTSLPYFNFLNRRDDDDNRLEVIYDEDDQENQYQNQSEVQHQSHSHHHHHHTRRRFFDFDNGGNGTNTNSESHNIFRSEFARKQREDLERYLLNLIRTVMFHPSANRLCKFLELSALSISLAHTGSHQAKAGMLRIEGISPSFGAWGRRGVGWREKKKTRWAAVRESYLVAVEDPSEKVVWDCWLIDGDFRIERPKRYYRLISAAGIDFEKGMFLLEDKATFIGTGSEMEAETRLSTSMTASSTLASSLSGTMHSIKHRAGKLFHLGHDKNDHAHSRETFDHTDTDARTNAHVPRSSLTRTRSGSTSSTSSSASSRPPTPLLDPSTNVDQIRSPTPREVELATRDTEHDITKSLDAKKKKKNRDASRHTFYLVNSQSRLRCTASTARQMDQWITALERIRSTSYWTGRNRFNSFAPIRLNVAVQWLADGRDYFWNLSRAISLAKRTIYIHDWWLSPELQLRRPNKPKWRLDSLLQRKAAQGVMVYIIVYNEVSSRTTPTDSNYTKQTMTSLHPNIMVQRSPSHFQTGTFFWAHHEKLCVVDESIAFMGGIDACFGRWDTPQHILIDDPELNGGEKIWPGKDYSNPRILDFHTLNKPLDDLYDREKVPRMPWHDVSLQVVGQPARDLCRHFVQRWNFLLRIKNHSRKLPFLLPPPDFRPSELRDLGLLGTCEVQVCRSAGCWSLGTPNKVEHSIQDAYLKAIQLSQHFVYIENQFFITSTVVNNVKVENQIGDALVERIVRAHREGTKWKCCIIIPLIPGFTFPVDHADASAVRIIMECQNRTISRGPNSIFARLRKEGIDPDDYIAIFSLRGWGKLKGDTLTTEQVYVHGKVCIIDDQLAIIGSANINERSQKGDRDSELAAVIRDTDMIDSTMDGQAFRVGRFAHSLRIRLMREHIGVDVDQMYEEEMMTADPMQDEENIESWNPDWRKKMQEESGMTKTAHGRKHTVRNALGESKDALHHGKSGVILLEEDYSQSPPATTSTIDDKSAEAGEGSRKAGIKSRQADSTATNNKLREEGQTYMRSSEKAPGLTSAQVPTLGGEMGTEDCPREDQAVDEEIVGELDGEGKMLNGDIVDPPQASIYDDSGQPFGASTGASDNDGTDDQFPRERTGMDESTEAGRDALRPRSILCKHLSSRTGAHPWTLPVPGPTVDPYGFEDPICDKFWKNTWVASAVHNTEIYRNVFHCVPDDLVSTWKQYKEFVLHHERLTETSKDIPFEHSRSAARSPSVDESRRPSQVDKEVDQDARPPTQQGEKPALRPPTTEGGKLSSSSHSPSPQNRDGQVSEEDSSVRVPSKSGEPLQAWEREEMEKLLYELRGHLVVYPHRFLEDEDAANNFLFNSDRYLPVNIYN